MLGQTELSVPIATVHTASHVNCDTKNGFIPLAVTIVERCDAAHTTCESRVRWVVIRHVSGTILHARVLCHHVADTITRDISWHR